MAAKIIEAEYRVTTTQFWEIKHIEGWPTDDSGEPRDLDMSHGWFIKWGLLHVQWDKDKPHVEYEATAEEHGEGDDHKWPDAEYVDGERMD